MAISFTPGTQNASNSWGLPDWGSLAGVVTLAIALRTFFFTGFFGSDDTHYVMQALAIASGEWIVSDYVGDLRYGVNLPMALFVKLLGASQFSANAWPFLCSIGEVGLVFYFGRREWGLREAIFSALAIALLPIHIHQAGRFMADPPLAFFISLSFVAFYIAEQRRSTLIYFAAGLACGAVFWVKEMVLLYAAVFPLYAVVIRELKRQWFWFVLGIVVMVAANCLLLWAITGNPWQVFDAARNIVGKFRVVGWIDNSALGYFKDLFFNGMTMGFVPFFALAGGLWWGRDWLRRRDDWATRYVVIWAAGLLGIFSFTVISISPLKFIAKQSNYMLIFAAPLCLLAGVFLARIKGVWLAVAMTALLIPAIILPALDQRSYQLFTSNSKGGYHFAVSKPGSVVYGGTNAYRMAEVLSKMQFGQKAENPIKPLVELFDADAKRAPIAGGFQAYVIYDPITATMDRFRADQGGEAVVINGSDDLPDCWQKLEALKPESVAWEGLVDMMGIDANKLPPFFAKRIARFMTNPLLPSLPAHVYGIQQDCVSAKKTNNPTSLK